MIDVVVARAQPLGLEVRLFEPSFSPLPLPQGTFGILLAYPGSSGAVRDHREVAQGAHDADAVVCVTTDLLALTLLEAPGHWGADVVVGSAQRFGVPMGYGGPHAGFMAVTEQAKRALPGRLVGVSVDSEGRPAYRLALQTREQHIRREKATSNICTAQVLLANVAAAYAAYHGPVGLTSIAHAVHEHATTLRAWLIEDGHEVLGDTWFDTLTVRAPGRAAAIAGAACAGGVNLRLVDADHIGISVDETTRTAVLVAVREALAGHAPSSISTSSDAQRGEHTRGLPENLTRRTPFLTLPTFSAYRSETEMMRYLRRLADADLALDRSMIPLRIVHDEAERGHRDDPDHMARLQRYPPLRSGRTGAGICRALRGARSGAVPHHRLRRSVASTQRGFAGRAGRASRHLPLPRL
ncbi:MAG: hypothetical protein M5U19_05300 [Microthrixaceae bacterium]|nr:hypothetical protein [Microthrixaceae bacterium]